MESLTRKVATWLKIATPIVLAISAYASLSTRAAILQLKLEIAEKYATKEDLKELRQARGHWRNVDVP